MRVLQVVQDLRPGGAERVVLSLIGALRPPDASAVAAAPGPWSSLFDCPQYPLPILERRPARIPLGAWQLDRAIRSFRPDVVHAHNPGVGVLTALATLQGRRVPALVSVHGMPEEDYPATATLLRRCGLPVVACGPGVATALEEHGLQVRATVVNGITAPPPARTRDDLHRDLGIPVDRALVVSVGRLVAQKDHGLAIAAMTHLPDVTLVIVGGGDLEGELRAAAVSQGVADRVVLSGTRDDARAILAAADVALLTSRWEGLPLVGLEALAAGAPLVATAVRGVQELLTDGVDALLVEERTGAAVATRIRRLLDDDALAERLRSAGAALVAGYTEGAMTSRFQALYRELV